MFWKTRSTSIRFKYFGALDDMASVTSELAQLFLRYDAENLAGFGHHRPQHNGRARLHPLPTARSNL